jgi:hypothetical protein
MKYRGRNELRAASSVVPFYAKKARDCFGKLLCVGNTTEVSGMMKQMNGWIDNKCFGVRSFLRCHVAFVVGFKQKRSAMP